MPKCYFAQQSIRPSSTHPCQKCLLSLPPNRPASTATALQPDPIEPLPSGLSAAPSPAPISPSTTYRVQASVMLSRPPLLTRDLTAFEKAYFLYQRRLNERLALPFSRYFYYQKGTPGDVDWKRKIRERRTPARDIGRYDAYSREEGWNDEVLVGARESEPEEQVEALLKDAEVELKEEEEGGEDGGNRSTQVVKEAVAKPLPRVTDADRAGDRRSLDRLLQRTLYLVVRRQDGRWWFPSDALVGKESLHTAAERILVQAGGLNMNTWIVGNIPLGHYVRNYQKPQVEKDTNNNNSSNNNTSREIKGTKYFFMKGRIMAGQANLKDNKKGLTDFQWLAKDEVQKILLPQDWSAVKNILAER
ncbi:MAG: hypothetical protein LQ344_006808 [Seirophora lacunosa]|nr:MAG: hypothetical protein LQ344_006808 [Seirophora lacunosa]